MSDRPRSNEISSRLWLRPWWPQLLGFLLFGLAIGLIHHELARFRLSELAAELERLSPRAIALALVATALGYATLTLFDALALRFLGKDLRYRRTALASFVGYAFAHSLGFALLSGGAVRYRLYSAWGLSALEIGAILAFNSTTTALGLASIIGAACLGEPHAIGAMLGVPVAAIIGVGLLLAALVLGYLALTAVVQRPLRVLGWQLRLPPLGFALTQTLIAVLDWSLAGLALYVLLPPGLPVGFFHLLGIFALGNLGGLLSHVPGGIGVFEAVILLAIPDGAHSAGVAAALIAYRLIYFLLPLLLAALLLGAHQTMVARSAVGRVGRQIGDWAFVMAPNLFALLVFTAGAMLLASGASPGVKSRLRLLADLVPLGVIELSHFFASIAGLLLLLVALGLRRRLDGAWIATVAILGASIVFALLKGLHLEQATILALTLVAIAPCRGAFYRKAALIEQRFSVGWLLAVAAVLFGVTWLGLFAYRHVDYSQEMWWRFVAEENAPRFLRASAGAIALFLMVGAAQLLRSSVRVSVHVPRGDLERARQIIAASADAPLSANLALLGDKHFLFGPGGQSFMMYGMRGRSWVAMGDPVGPADERLELLWSFRELCDRYGATPAFYQVPAKSIPHYLELGLAFQKLGERGVVPLEGFSLEGSKRSGLRYTLRRMRRDGCRFEVVPASGVPPILDDLAAVSRAWLAAKNVREKGFSIGRFDPQYIANFPVAVVHLDNRPIAFANVWTGGDRREVSVDLMRHLGDAPNGIMEYLFVELMLWGKEQGYAEFDLGMVPLAGLERRRLAPLWTQAGAFLFRYGEHFYNFQGLLRFKHKFDPLWEPRYLAAPGGFALPRVLRDVTLLISGGVGGLIAR